MEQAVIEAAFRKIYCETNQIYDQYKPRLGLNARGFKILYGPPLPNPPILFVGDQPGGQIAEDFKNERNAWPTQCEYATESWPLANNMQMMFGSTFLMRCVGINTNFFRAPDAETWSRIPWHLRTTLEEFCLKHLKDMIELIQPKEIVIIGFSTLEKFSTATPFLRGTKNRVLMKKGQIFRRNAVATLHLSGARIASDDRRSIAQAIRSLVERHTT